MKFMVKLFLAGLALSALSCSTAKKLCDRFDECDQLESGYTAEECEEDVQSCVDRLSDSDQDDWEGLIDACLDLNCERFNACYWEVPWC